jgi:hypothetical protein
MSLRGALWRIGHAAALPRVPIAGASLTPTLLADARPPPAFPRSARHRLTKQDKNKYNTPKYRLVVRFVRAPSRLVASSSCCRCDCARFWWRCRAPPRAHFVVCPNRVFA